MLLASLWCAHTARTVWLSGSAYTVSVLSVSLYDVAMMLASLWCAHCTHCLAVWQCIHCINTVSIAMVCTLHALFDTNRLAVQTAPGYSMLSALLLCADCGDHYNYGDWQGDGVYTVFPLTYSHPFDVGNLLL